MLKYFKIESGRLAVAPNEEAADIVMMGSLSQEQRSVLVKEYEITEHTIASAFDSDIIYTITATARPILAFLMDILAFFKCSHLSHASHVPLEGLYRGHMFLR